jgi:ribosomal protein S18 acetylase RimI-like enzyme
MRDVGLRPVSRADEPFLRRVYASTRAAELALVPWDDAQKEAFLRFQFDAQSTDYDSSYPDATRDVVLVGGAPAGRLYVDRRPGEIRILDVALLPQFRARGVGTVLLRELLDEAAASGVAASIYVERNNPAQALYRRLGFRVTADDGGVYVLMQWRSGSAEADDQVNTAS